MFVWICLLLIFRAVEAHSECDKLLCHRASVSEVRPCWSLSSAENKFPWAAVPRTLSRNRDRRLVCDEGAAEEPGSWDTSFKS